MRALFIVIGACCLAIAGLLVYSEYKRVDRFNWNCYLAGVMTFIGGLYMVAKPLIPGKLYHMGNNGLTEVPQVQVLR